MRDKSGPPAFHPHRAKGGVAEERWGFLRQIRGTAEFAVPFFAVMEAWGAVQKGL